MSELITARIRAHATRLGLPGLAEDPAALAVRAEQATLGYLDFLDLILGEEAGLKDSRRCRAALHASGLPHHKTRRLSVVRTNFPYVSAGQSCRVRVRDGGSRARASAWWRRWAAWRSL